MPLNCIGLPTRLYPTSFEISTKTLQKRERARVVITHVRVPVLILKPSNYMYRKFNVVF